MTFPHADYISKKTPGAVVQAIQYQGPPTTLLELHWAACELDGSNGRLATDLDFFKHPLAFPVNRGRGMAVKPGEWIVRHADSSIEIIGDDTFFKSLYAPKAASDYSALSNQTMANRAFALADELEKAGSPSSAELIRELAHRIEGAK